MLAALRGTRALGWGWSPAAALGATAAVGVVTATLAALALLLMCAEGVAYDWSVLHLRDVLDAPASTAALAYGAFATAMTAGRLLADRAVARCGPVAVLSMLAGPAIVGQLTRFAPFNLTFFVPAACCLVAAGTAGILRSRSTASRPL